MSALICDVETTISNKGNVYDQTNKLVVAGFKKVNYEYPYLEYVEHEEWSLDFVQELIDETSVIVAFNAKFDLAWLRRIGVCLDGVRVWDCQLAEFLLNNQKTPYPSLNDATSKYGLAPKLDVVEQEFWNKGIDTDAIPREILSEYLTQDLVLTENVFRIQYKQFTGKEYEG